MTAFFTADQHFGHDRIRAYCARPFATVHEMNVALTDNWNRVVKPGDTVYHLGDFAWDNAAVYRKRLNGKIILIRGNHDKPKNLVDSAGKFLFESLHDLYNFKQADVHIVLCHFSLRVWGGSHHGSWSLFGHSHGKLPPLGLSWDIGVDSNNYTPKSLDEVVEIMRKRKAALEQGGFVLDMTTAQYQPGSLPGVATHPEGDDDVHS